MSPLRTGWRRLPIFFVIALLAGYANAIFAQSTPAVLIIPSPNEGIPEMLKKRADEQARLVKQYKSFHDFKFTDRRVESGITFEQNAVDDSSKHWIPVHYDHGSAVAVADVDGDGLLDIYFANQLGGNELWRNLGGGKFENITATAGVGLSDKSCVGASFADIDNDGLPDLFVTTVKMGNVLFKNMGHGRFKDVTREAGVGYVGHSSGAVFFDFNNDGLLDLFVANVGIYTSDRRGPGGFYEGLDNAFLGHLYPARAEQSILYQNMGGGKFKDVSKEMHLQDMSWSGDASFCDFDHTGYPSLYVLNMQGNNHFYENQHGKTFADATLRYFPKTPFGAMGIKFFDFNQDGLMDLYITDMHSDMTDSQSRAGERNLQLDFEKVKSDVWCSAEWMQDVLKGASNNIFGNAFYKNLGQGKFAEISQAIGAETYWPWGIGVADLNADGFEDVFVTGGMGHPFRYGINSVLLNEFGKRFYDSEFVLGVEPRANGRIDKEYFTLDCSGEDKGDPRCQGRTGKVTYRGSLSTRGVVIFDIDDDGDLDIVTNEMNDHPMVLVSNLTERKKIHFLKIKLIGAKSNRDGLGATVKVHTGGRTLTQYHDGKWGYLAQSLIPLYFGLGDDAKVDTVEVLWPSGIKQTVTKDIPTNKLLTITEEKK